MTYEAEHHVRSVLVGDLRLPPQDAADQAQVDPGEKVPMLVELNLRYPGGLARTRRAVRPARTTARPCRLDHRV